MKLFLSGGIERVERQSAAGQAALIADRPASQSARGAKRRKRIKALSVNAERSRFLVAFFTYFNGLVGWASHGRRLARPRRPFYRVPVTLYS